MLAEFMKSKFTLLSAVVSVIGTGALTLAATIAAFKEKPQISVNAVTLPDGCVSASLKSTQNINLNDTSEENIRSYYSSLNSLPSSERQGTNLLKNLKPILYNMKYYSYDTVWKIYEITDRDWNLSPASGTAYGSYNSGTNIINNYSFGSKDNKKNNPFVRPLYRNPGVEEGYINIWGAHTGNNNNNINREHVWCQSRGFKAGSGASGPAGTDVHHLICGDGRVNMQEHNNNPYGNVGSVSMDASNIYTWLSGNKNGSPKHTSPQDQSTVVFEPQDCDKGDIARAIFYMAARYNNWSGNETITQFEPNLIVTDYATSNGDSVISSASTPVAMGILSDLLQWHQLDPVDEYEIHRNNLIYENFQMNRNPFIDFPEWVDYIWGKPVLNGEKTEIISYDNTPTGYATPSTDPCYDYKEQGETTSETSSEESSSSQSPSSSEEITGNVDVLDRAFTGVTNTTYTSWSGKKGSATSAVYAGNSAGGYSAIQLRSDKSTAGIISTNTGGQIKSVTVAWNSNTASGRTLDIYGKNSAYSAPSDLYNESTRGTLLGSIVNGTSTAITVDGDYSFIGIRSRKDALYCDEIQIEYKDEAAPVPTSITATTLRSFDIGDTITKSDIVVKDDLGNTINDYEFTPYQFTYEDAPSGGEIQNKEFNISYNELSTTLSIPVQRMPYEVIDDIHYELNATSGSFDGVAGTEGTPAESNSLVLDEDYNLVATQSYKFTSNQINYLSFKTSYRDTLEGKSYFGSDSIIYNETAFFTPIKEVSYALASSPTTNPIIEYSHDTSSWSTINDGYCYYFKIRCEGLFRGYINFSEISITLYGEETPANLINYIMFEDTVNQCLEKFDLAVFYFNLLDTTNRTLFMTNNSYQYLAARTRLLSWAEANQKTIQYINGDYIVTNNSYRGLPAVQAAYESSSKYLLILVGISAATGVGIFVAKHRKNEE